MLEFTVQIIDHRGKTTDQPCFSVAVYRNETQHGLAQYTHSQNPFDILGNVVQRYFEKYPEELSGINLDA